MLNFPTAILKLLSYSIVSALLCYVWVYSTHTYMPVTVCFADPATYIPAGAGTQSCSDVLAVVSEYVPGGHECSVANVVPSEQ